MFITLQVAAMIHTKLEEDTSLEQEVTRNWDEVISHYYVFDRHQREVSGYYGNHMSLPGGTGDYTEGCDPG